MVVRRYNLEWEKDPLLAPWISKVKTASGEENVLCNFCNQILVSHRPNLIRHAATKSHKINDGVEVHAKKKN